MASRQTSKTSFRSSTTKQSSSVKKQRSASKNGPTKKKLEQLEQENVRLRGLIKEHQDIEKSLRHQKSALTALAGISSLRKGKLGKTLEKVTAKTAQALRVKRVSIWKISEAGSQLDCRDLFELPEKSHTQGMVLKKEDCPQYFAHLSGKEPLLVREVETDKRSKEFLESYLRPLGISSTLDMPIVDRGKVVGVLCLEHVGPSRNWEPHEVSFARSIASLVRRMWNERLWVDKLKSFNRSKEQTPQVVRYGQMLSEISSKLIAIPVEDIDSEIQVCLKKIGQFIDVDRVVIYKILRNKSTLQVCYQWVASGCPSSTKLESDINLDGFPWAKENWLGGQVTAISDIDRLPTEAAAERSLMIQLGYRSSLGLPLVVGGESVGRLGVACQRQKREWPDDLIQWLRLVGEILGNAMARNRGDTALRISESHFQQLFENSPFCIHEIDCDGNITTMNKAGLSMLGLSHPEEVVGKPYFNAIDRRDRDAIWKLFQNALNGESSDFEFYTPKGCVFASSFDPLWNDAGEIRGVMGITRDVSDAKKAQEELAESKARFQRLSEATFEGIGFSEHGKLIDFNPQLAEMFGYSSEELLNKEVLDLVAKEDRSLVSQVLQSETEEPHEFMALRKNGSVFPVEVQEKSMPWKSKVVRVLAVTDNTEHKKSAENLRQSEHRLVEAQRIAHMGDFIWDFDKDEVTWSTALRELMGYGPSDHVDINFVGENIYHPEDRERIDKWLLDGVESGSTELPANVFRVFHQNGALKYVRTVGVIERGDGGSVRVIGTVQDITEQRQAEEELEERAEFDQLLSDISSHFIDVPLEVIDETIHKALEQVGRFLKLDRCSLGIIPAGEGELTISHSWKPKPISATWSKYPLEKFSMVQTAFQRGEPLVFPPPGGLPKSITKDEKEIIEASGMKKFVAIPVSKVGQDTTFLVMSDLSNESRLNVSDPSSLLPLARVFRDILARKRSEEALRESEQRFRAIFDHAPIGIDVVDKHGKSVRINKALEDILGYKEEEVRGMQTPNLTVEEDMPASLRVMDRLVSGQSDHDQLEKRYVRKDGAVIWASTSVSAVRDAKGQLQYLIAAILDISNLKWAESELKKALGQLELAIRTAELGVWRMNVDTGRLESNEQIQEIYDLNPSALNTDVDSLLRRIHLEDKERISRSMNELLEGKQVHGIEFRVIRPNGDIRYINGSGSPVYDATGKFVEIVFINTDITPLKKNEQDLRRARANLEVQVEARTTELQAALKEVKSADRIKAMFLATMSHELRTPLNSIIGFTGMLLKGMAGPVNEEQKKQLNIVRQSSWHLLDIINDILDVSRIEAGKLEISAVEFDVRKSMVGVIESLTPAVEEKGLKLEMDLADEIGFIHTDPKRFEQVLINLLNNAIKFTDQGQVRLQSYIENSRLFVRIEDTGIGIRESDLNKLFTPFQQIDIGSSRVQEGTGLGLAISQRLARLMGGDIDVKSEWGKGSIFTFVLPQ